MSTMFTGNCQSQQTASFMAWGVMHIHHNHLLQNLQQLIHTCCFKTTNHKDTKATPTPPTSVHAAAIWQRYRCQQYLLYPQTTEQLLSPGWEAPEFILNTSPWIVYFSDFFIIDYFSDYFVCLVLVLCLFDFFFFFCFYICSIIYYKKSNYAILYCTMTIKWTLQS